MSSSKRSLLSAAVVLSVLFVSCAEEKTASADPAALPQGMILIDLSAYGKPFSLPVPDTSAAPLTITEEPDGALCVRSGKSFGMSIYEQSADLNLKKDDIRSDEVNRLKRMVREDTASIMWESAITETEYHFVCNRKLRGSDYSFSDIPGTGFNEASTTSMLESALQAREKTE